MESILGNSQYKSGWKRLTREDETEIITAYKKMEPTEKKLTEKVAAEKQEMQKTAEPAALPDSAEILKLLAELNGKIDDLTQYVTSQDDAFNTLLNQMKAEAASGRKGFGFLKK
ncbi:hypothetical protein [Papillibacter cinnamivorans]|nr:hypothetical protein [Papillibacter cinnamivorans]